jgi:cell division protein FtsQ
MRRLTAIAKSAPARPASGRWPQRQRPRSTLARHLRMAGYGALVLSSLAGTAYWSWSSGWIAYLAQAGQYELVRLSADLGLRLRTLRIEGRKETDQRAILASLDAAKGQALLAVDLDAARQRLIDLPWVTDAIVERRLPDTLYVQLVEAEPMALWQKQGRLNLVGRSGEILIRGDVGRFAGLPIIVGDEAPLAAAALFDLMAGAPELAAKVTAAVYVGGRRWNLRLDNGIDVKLPEIDAASAWARLADMELRHGLLARNIDVIDLRQPEKLVVRQRPSAAPPEGEPENPAAKPDSET